VAESTGSSRIVPGVSVLHPVGNPVLALDEERGLRRALLERALEALSRPVAQPAAE
jgi:glycine reductase